MKKLAITVVIALGLLVAADFGAAAAAEYQVSQQMRAQLNLPDDPQVRINGFPFLTQLAVGDFHDVEVSADSVPIGQLHEVGLQASLHDVRLSPTELTAGKPDKVEVDDLVGRVKLHSADVGRVIGIPDLRVAPAPKGALKDTGEKPGDLGSSGSDATDNSGDSPSAGQGPSGGTVDRTKAAISLSGTVNIAGSDTHVNVLAVLALLDGKMKIEPRKVDLSNSKVGTIALPQAFQSLVLNQFTTTIDPGILPFHVNPTSVGVEEGALTMEGTAKNTTITRNGISAR